MSFSDIESKFNISINQILNATYCNYTQLTNNYPTSIVYLLLTYRNGFTDFKNELDKQYKLIIQEINQKLIISKEYENMTDIDFSLKLFNKTGTPTEQIKLLAAKKSINRIYKQLLTYTDLYDTEYYEGFIYLFGNIKFDIETLLGKGCRRNPEQSVEQGIFKLSQDLLCNYIQPNSPSIPTTIFLIRQSIELKILREIGFISAIDNTNGIPKIIKISNVLNFLQEKQHANLINCILPIELLQGINNWANRYIHTGNFNQMYWEVEWCHHILKEFVYPKLGEKAISLNKNFSKEEFRKDFKEFIFKKFPDKISINWK